MIVFFIIAAISTLIYIARPALIGKRTLAVDEAAPDDVPPNSRTTAFSSQPTMLVDSQIFSDVLPKISTLTTRASSVTKAPVSTKKGLTTKSLQVSSSVPKSLLS